MKPFGGPSQEFFLGDKCLEILCKNISHPVLLLREEDFIEGAENREGMVYLKEQSLTGANLSH